MTLASSIIVPTEPGTGATPAASADRKRRSHRSPQRARPAHTPPVEPRDPSGANTATSAPRPQERLTKRPDDDPEHATPMPRHDATSAPETDQPASTTQRSHRSPVGKPPMRKQAGVRPPPLAPATRTRRCLTIPASARPAQYFA